MQHPDRNRALAHFRVRGAIDRLLDLAQLLVVQSVLDSSAHAPRLYRLLNPLSNTGLAVSELTWLTSERPAELQAHWDREYIEVDTASAKMALLERQGLSPIGYFVLPEYCWLDNYYRPMQERFRRFLEVHRNSDAAKAIVASEEVEIALYELYRTFVSYGYYIARKSGE
jgi:hypothetical protein